MGKLTSKKEIMEYLELSWPSIIKEGFPWVKIGGRIMSHTEDIDEHIRNRLKSTCQVSKHAK